MLFKRIFNKSGGDLGWIYLVQKWGQVAGPSGHGNEFSGSIKCWEVLEKLGRY